MWTIRNRDADADVRGQAAFDAHKLIVRTAMILGEHLPGAPAERAPGGTSGGQYDLAAEIWPDVRKTIVAQG